MGLSEEAINEVVKHLVEMATRSKTFSEECFSLLSITYDDPATLSDVFSRFVSEVLTGTGFEKIMLLKNIHKSVRMSGVMLDGFLFALYQFNMGSKSVTALHAFLNKELPKEDWSALTRSLLLKIGGNIERGVLDTCIFELLFSHSRPEDLAKSGFVEVEAKVTYSMLSETAQNNFADAVLLKYQGQPEVVISKLIEYDPSFARAVFRRREDFSILIEAMRIQSIPPAKYGQVILELHEKKLEKNPVMALSLFIGMVLPHAHLLNREFLMNIIQSPDFPSNDPLFPVQDFIASRDCVACVNFRVFFHIQAVNPSEDFARQLFGSVIQGHSHASIFHAIFVTAEKVYDHMKFLFLYYIENDSSLTPEMIRDVVLIFMPGRSTVVCDFCLEAIKRNVKPELFLSAMTLEAFFSYAFLHHQAVLHFLFEVSVAYIENEVIAEFWLSPLTMPSVVDAIVNNYPCAYELTEFLLRISLEAPAVFIESISHHLRDLPCFKQFSENCKARFPPDSGVILTINGAGLQRQF